MNGREAGKAIKAILDSPGFKDEAPLSLERWSDDDQIEFKHVDVRHEDEENCSLSGISLSFKGRVAGMQISRREAGGQALSVLTIDSPASEELLATVREAIDAALVREINITE